MIWSIIFQSCIFDETLVKLCLRSPFGLLGSTFWS